LSEDNEKKAQAEKLKQKELQAKKKFEKEQALKKKQIEDYKRKKLEAEEMLANADLDYEDEFEEPPLQQQQHYQPPTKAPEDMDDEDRYLEEILNRNYTTGKAPPAVN